MMNRITTVHEPGDDGPGRAPISVAVPPPMAVRLQPRAALPGLQVTGAELLLETGALHEPQPPDAAAVGGTRGIAVDNALLHRAVQCLKDLVARELRQPLMVRLSVDRWLAPGLSDELTGLLADASLGTSQLEVGVDESDLLAHIDQIGDAVSRVRAAGIRVAVVNVSGGGAFTWLPRVRADLASFHHDPAGFTADSETGTRLLQALVSLLQSFDVRTVATGVPSVALIRRLIRTGCDHVQGPGFAAPLLFGECCSFFAAHGRSRGPNPFSI
jgi:EAL domain-containing protein (putative c-di-GMP-specific phosphodiesterase class I)